MLGGGVAHPLEGVAALAEVPRPVGDEFEFAGLHLAAVLGALEVAELGREPVDASVEPSHLGVEAVDEAPEQGLALVGELEAVGGDARGEDAERLAGRVEGVAAVPDLAGVELAGLGGCAEEPRVLADGGGDGVFVSVDAVDVVHGGLLAWRMKGGSAPERSGVPP